MFTARRTLPTVAALLACCTLTACGERPARTAAPDAAPAFSAVREHNTTERSPESSSETTTPQTTTVTQTVRQEPAPKSTAAASDSCGPDQQAAYAEAMSKLDPLPGYNQPWRLADSGYDSCAALSWMTVTIEGATVSSPYHILLFHNGEYLGTGTFEAYGFAPRIKQVSDSEIAVTYRWPRAGEGNAEASGTTRAGFHWDEDLQECVMTE